MSNFYVADGAACMSNNNEWETPQKLFDELNAKYHFTLDPCASEKKRKVQKVLYNKR